MADTQNPAKDLGQRASLMRETSRNGARDFRRREERWTLATTLYTAAICNEEPQEKPMLRGAVDLYPLGHGTLLIAMFDTICIPEIVGG